MHIHFKKSYFLCFIWNLLLQKCENCPDFLHFCWIIEEEPYAFFLCFGNIFCQTLIYFLSWQDLPLFAPLTWRPNQLRLLTFNLQLYCGKKCPNLIWYCYSVLIQIKGTIKEITINYGGSEGHLALLDTGCFYPVTIISLILILTYQLGDFRHNWSES